MDEPRNPLALLLWLCRAPPHHGPFGPGMNDLESTVGVLTLSGALYDRNGRVIRAGSEGVLAGQPTFWQGVLAKTITGSRGRITTIGDADNARVVRCKNPPWPRWSSHARCLAPKGPQTDLHMITTPHPGKKFERLFAGGLSALGLLSALAQPLRAQATHTAQDWAHSPADLAQRESLKDYLARLRSALLALKDRPEQQQPLKLTASSTAESRSGVRRLRIRNFQLLSDGARSTAEYNLGPGSWPTVVGVLGSAVAQDFLIQAALKGIPLDELEVVFTSRPGAAPSSGSGTRVTYPRNLAYTAYIVSPASDAELEELRQTVERVSPVLNLVSQSQAIEHGKLVHTRTAAQREGKSLEGLREFLAEKRLASQGAKPPEGPSRFVAAVVRNTGEPPLRAHVKVEGATGIRHIRTDASNFQIIHDSPRYLAGHNLGPVAEEHILGVMITCLTHIYEMQAASRQVVLDTLELEVEGTLTPRIGSTDTAPRYKDIRYSVYIGSPESKETIEQLQRAVEAICPIYNMLKDPQEIKGSIVRGPFPEKSRTTAAN